ncbi:MAG: amidohydrolase [Deltaproteobacteria bacterium]|nr:amidohydrolase [Deltaproteobacteria bacterium]
MRAHVPTLPALLLAASLAGPAAAAEPMSKPSPHPDIPVGTKLTAYVGPRFVTGESMVPEAAAVLVDETGRVRALLKHAPPAGLYPLVKLPGALAVAGLHDAHLHVQGIGQARAQVQLLGAKSPAELKKRVADWVAQHKDATAVRGRGWDQSLFAGGAWPSARDLEGATDKPALLSRVDGHAALANKQLLALAGITKDTRDPPGGKIHRDDKGEPTGVLIDNAIDLAEQKLPAPSDADIERFLLAGLEACADGGLTSVTDQGMSLAALRALVRLDEAGKLPTRVFVYLDGAEAGSLDQLGVRAPTARVRVLGVKLYADGAMGSRGAALLAPYSDDPGNTGLLLTEPKLLLERVRAVHNKGFAAAIHAIGDRGNRVVLDTFDASPAPAGVRDRVEHAQLVDPGDIKRFARRGAIASMQPTHATSDMRWAEARVGKGRLAGAYAWRSMLQQGVALAFGSDAPVEDERPQLGIYAALTRQDAEGQPPAGFLPEQRVAQREALAAFAAGSAYAVGMEQHLGALTPGMFFDVSLFADDAALAADRGDARAWLRTKPAGVVIGGALRAPKSTR